MLECILFSVSCDGRVRLRLTALVGRGVRSCVAALDGCFVSRLLLSLSRRGVVMYGSQQAMRFALHSHFSYLVIRNGSWRQW
jgi:hypothetical protein